MTANTTGVVRHGDHDPLSAAVPDDTTVAGLCDAVHPNGMLCTRLKGHDDRQHVACGPGHVALAVWS